MLKVSRYGYYDFLHRGSSKRELEKQKFIEEINKAHKKSRETYGS